MDCSFPKSHYASFLNSRFKSYEVLKISTKVYAGSHCQCSKFCPKLPKSAKLAQRWNFEIPPKIEILVFFKNKNFCM
jgi:hypothetical protein